MLDTATATLFALLGEPTLLGLIALAVLIGIFFGVVPGLGGKLGIVLLIPFVFGMDMLPGAVFLLAMHAVVHTGGSIPSILLGIPGTGPDAATVVDGYPMTKNGEAGRALGASLSASAIGGVIGAAFFALALPLLKPVVLAFSPAEFFLLAVLGITFIAALSGESMVKGLIVGCLGLMLAMVGLNPHTGEPRFTLGLLSLWDGVDLVTAVLAMFAIPEMVDLGVKGGSVAGERAEPARYRLRQVIQGMGDIVTHRWLTLRTSLIGALLGVMPGLGGEAASWICYGHAVQSSKTPERFGHGAVEGVIGPETANNSKEGGSLLPTLFFGVPGSSGMAIMLGAFVMLGIQPGPGVLVNQLDLVWMLIWALVLSNLFAVAVFLACAQQLSLVAHLRSDILIPLVFCLAVLGSLLSSGNWQHLVILVVLGALGCGLKRHGWPRPPFAIGIVLGSIAENSLHQALSIWGPAFFLRPGALILTGLTAGSVGFYFWRLKRRRRGRRSASLDDRCEAAAASPSAR